MDELADCLLALGRLLKQLDDDSSIIADFIRDFVDREHKDHAFRSRAVSNIKF